MKNKYHDSLLGSGIIDITVVSMTIKTVGAESVGSTGNLLAGLHDDFQGANIRNTRIYDGLGINALVKAPDARDSTYCDAMLASFFCDTSVVAVDYNGKVSGAVIMTPVSGKPDTLAPWKILTGGLVNGSVDILEGEMLRDLFTQIAWQGYRVEMPEQVKGIPGLGFDAKTIAIAQNEAQRAGVDFSTTQFTPDDIALGRQIHAAVAATGDQGLDLNSVATYIQVGKNFGATSCFVPFQDADGNDLPEFAGLVTGFMIPGTDTFFTWQVASHAPKQNLPVRIMLDITSREVCSDVTAMHTTITADNIASQRVFHKYAHAVSTLQDQVGNPVRINGVLRPKSLKDDHHRLPPALSAARVAFSEQVLGGGHANELLFDINRFDNDGAHIGSESLPLRGQNGPDLRKPKVA